MSALEIVLISVVSVILFCSIAGIIIHGYYKKFVVNKAKDFIFLDQYVTDNDIVYLGDSLTDFFQISEYVKNKPLANRGIAGDSTKDVMNRLYEVLSLKPKTLFLQIGINDIIYNKKVTAGEVVQRIIEIADSFKNIGTKVYVISLYPINRKKMNFSWVSCRHASNLRINAINEILEKTCEEKKYQFINIHPYLLDEQNNLKKEYTVEGLHLTVIGYGVVYNQLKPYLEK